MASIDKQLEELFNRLIGNDDEERELVEAIETNNQTRWETDEGIGTCGYSDINNGFARFARGLPDYQGRPIIEAIRQGSPSVTIGDRTFAMPSAQAPPAQQVASYVNVVEQTTNNIDASRDTSVINNINAIGSNVNLNQPVASGDRSSAIGGDANAPVQTGNENLAAATGGGDFTGSTGDGPVIDESVLAGTNFGAGGTAVAAGGDANVAGSGGTAVGPGAVGGDINVADRGGTIAEDGGVAAGGLAGTVGQATTTGGSIDQSADQTQLAGGNIDQSADTDVDVTVAEAEPGGVALASSDEVDMSDPMA